MIVITVIALIAESLITLPETTAARLAPAVAVHRHRILTVHSHSLFSLKRSLSAMKLKRRTVAATAALTLLGGTLAACAGNTGGAAGETGKVKIMIGGIDKIIYLPAKLTEQLGFFADEGVEVQLLTEPSGAQAENVLVSGDVQGVVGFYDHAIRPADKGQMHPEHRAVRRRARRGRGRSHRQGRRNQLDRRFRGPAAGCHQPRS